MPQTFVALQCAFCNTFQGQLDKKAKKFTCVICNAKQSFRTIFAVSNSGKDIRLTVQQLNELQGAQDDLKGSEQVQQLQQQVLAQQSNEPAAQATTQNWQEFAAEDADSGDDDAAAGETGFVTSLPEAQLGKRQQRAMGAQQGNSKRVKQLGGHDSGSVEPAVAMQQQWSQHQVGAQQYRPAPSTVAQMLQQRLQGVASRGTGNSAGQPVPGWDNQQQQQQQQQQPGGPGQQQQRQPLQRLPQQGQQPQQQGKPGTAGSSWQGVRAFQSVTGPQQQTQQQPGGTQQQPPAWPLAQQQGQQALHSKPHQQWQAAPQQPQGQQSHPPQQWQAPKQQQQPKQQGLQPLQQQQQRQRPPQQQQQQAWQQRLPAHKPLARLPGAHNQAVPTRPAAAAAAGASKAAAGAWSTFVDEDQAAGDCSDDEGGGMCFVTDADVAGHWA